MYHNSEVEYDGMMFVLSFMEMRSLLQYLLEGTDIKKSVCISL
jgi:hypothetical protein